MHTNGRASLRQANDLHDRLSVRPAEAALELVLAEHRASAIHWHYSTGWSRFRNVVGWPPTLWSVSFPRQPATLALFHTRNELSSDDSPHYSTGPKPTFLRAVNRKRKPSSLRSAFDPVHLRASRRWPGKTMNSLGVHAGIGLENIVLYVLGRRGQQT